MTKQPNNQDVRKLERTIEIESDVPIPPSAARKPLFYDAYTRMKVGDSFYVPGYAGGLVRLREQIAGAATRYRQIYDKEFFTTCRVENGGVRCWRIAKPFNFDKYQKRAKAANDARNKKRTKDAKEQDNAKDSTKA